MVEIVYWPCEALHPRDATFFLRHATRSGGRSIVGPEQVLSTGASWWEVTYALPTQFDGAALRQFEVLVMRMQGRRNIASICVCDPFRYGVLRSPLQQPFSDATWFSDGTGWIRGGETSSQPFKLIAPATTGDTSIMVGLTNPVRPPMVPGDLFSLAGFLYRVTSTAPDGTVSFLPPLRRPHVSGAQLDTDTATFWGRLASDEEGERAREMLRWGAPVTMRFVEAFDGRPA